MTLLVAWLVFPAALTVLAVGCGLLVDLAAGRRLPLALIPAVGFAAIVVVGFFTLEDATAELSVPVVVAIAIAGLAVGVPRLRRLPSGWALLAAAGTYAVYAATIVLSGKATFAGYIRLDDTATWMALTDRVMEHGRNLDGLAPSSYEATLAFNLADGYPVGAFLPLGVGRAIVGTDVAWLIQPYMAWIAAVLSLGLWTLARPLVESPRLRAAAVFIAAQPALLFGYFLWGGIKEVIAAALIAAGAALVGHLCAERFGFRALIPAAVVAASLAAVLSAGGLVWLVPGLALALVVAARTLRPAALAGRTAALLAMLVALSVPVIAGGLLPPTSSPLTDASARGNLLGPLEPAQVAGIWPAGDFRVDPSAGLLVAALIALAILLACYGLLQAWRRRSWGALAYVGGTLAAAAAIYAFGSPWVDAKALATASPAIPFAAMVGAAAAIAGGRRLAGAIAVALVALGVLWSNALAYRDANLAPRDQLAELERIGDRIAGQGPTLMTEYQPYGVRHFLRDAEPEGASELRRRQVRLVTGDTLPKGETADTDAIDPGALSIYRTLVLRRSPAQSRPPAAYSLIWRGRYYEVWQRPAGPAPVDRRIGLGGKVQPVGRPDCGAVRALAAGAGPGSELVAATRPPVIEVPLGRATYPSEWAVPGSASFPIPRGAGELEAQVEVPDGGFYEVWLGGSIRPHAELRVDGEPAGEVRNQLNNAGQYVRLGGAELGPGIHLIDVQFDGSDLHPGSGGTAGAIGPLVLSPSDAADARLVRVPPGRAPLLCGRDWDWVELDRGGE